MNEKATQVHMDRIENLARGRGLAEVERATGDDVPALTIAGQPFVSLREKDVLALLCPIDQKILLLEISPDIYFETESEIGQEAVLVRLDRISDEELSLRIGDAWAYRRRGHD